MIEQAQMNMEQISRMNGDVLSAQSTELLSKLLAIEAEATDGAISTESLSVHVPENEELGEVDNSVVRMDIPCFGTVRIARSGVLSRELHAPVIDMHDSTKSLEAATHALNFDDFAENDGSRTTAEASHSSANGLNAQLDDFQQQYHPRLTAGLDDWAFQGLDMAMFDS